MAKIRTINFLPDYFQTTTNTEVLAATLDQLVNPPSLMKIQGYVGSKLGYGVNAKDHYVPETTATRTNYQLTPSVVFTAPSTSINPPGGTATDFITYPGMLDALSLADGVTNNNSRLFNSQFYSWDSFTDLDKIINYTQYYWLPEGPPAVTIATATVYSSENYNITSLSNGYEITTGTSTVGSVDPQLTLMRGGTYTFNVDQSSQFWIQSAPGVSGYSPTQPNESVRNVYGVTNNGASQGVVTFTVPLADAQSQYVFAGSTPVDVVSTMPFAEVEGQLVNGFAGIDGVTSLEGLTVLFYDSIPNEIGYTSEYFNETPYDTNQVPNGDPYDPNNALVAPPLTLNVSASSSATNQFTLASGTTSVLVANNGVTFSMNGNYPTFGGITPGQVYYATAIDSTHFTISETLGGTPVTLTTGSGSMTLNVNQGLWEEGFYSNVSQNFYTVTYVGDPGNQIIRLIPTATIPTDVNIIPTYGTQWNNIPFYRNTQGGINPVPAITAPLNRLYYQDGTNPESGGIINIVDDNTAVIIDVDTDIIGKKNYISPNGVTFTNGLLVTFNGNIVPSKYLEDQYYVQGVGTAITLVPASSLVCPEKFTEEEYIPFSSGGFDDLNYDGELNIPAVPDYITIARDAINMNAWSRSNRWFHTDVISATAQYNNDPSIVTTYATSANRALRPIIEFYPNLKLFNSGILGKLPVDFIDTTATNALNQVAGQVSYYPDIQTYTTYTATIAATTPIAASALVPGTKYQISTYGNTDWNAVAGTTNQNYGVGTVFTCEVAGSGTGYALPLSTTVTVPASAVTGSFTDLMFVADSAGVLPTNSQITNITGTTTLTLTVSWNSGYQIPATTNVSIVASDLDVSDYALFPNARVIFAADEDPNVRNKIYVVEFSQISEFSTPVITLTAAEDGVCLPESMTVVSRGYTYQGDTFFYDGTNWNSAQQKTLVNQAPLFDIFDSNGISLGDQSVYVSTSFAGCTLFSYGIGTGENDPILGFPIRYSNVDNIGDISFDVSLNLNTFSYVNGTSPVTENVNIGYVYNYSDITTYVRQLGWQTAAAESTQYQVFEFNYTLGVSSATFMCDVLALPEPTTSSPGWPSIKVYVNNEFQTSDEYTVIYGTNNTIITLNTAPTTDTVIQILVLSNQVSQTAYYDIPLNLNNNPLNQELTAVNLGDIRIQYQDIFYNAPNTSGPVFGPNNYRDCGNISIYGTEIIQNSASLVLPGAFMRGQGTSIFDALLFNSREYIIYKQLIVNTVQNANYVQRYTPSSILDQAIQEIASANTPDQSFFWSDMLPSQTPYISNTYTFNSLSSSTFYPLSQVYNFETANYNGVLVYHITTITGVTVEKQLLTGVDYVISTEAPSLEVLITLQPGDQIVVKEYNQTYGSYVPNTPTKLGLYPAFQPEVVLDSNYSNPTWFIKGHDGSYTKLYGTYNQTLGVLTDFRDQALFEFEMRVYNNLKLSTIVPISEYEVVPGFFRNPTFSWNEFLEMYSPAFLNWVGQNRLDYKTQYYNSNDSLTYNYDNSANKINGSKILQGYWRGIYQYFYDTTTPDQTPWQMLGLANEPSWWVDRYGPAPWTSDNAILWGDLEAGYIWNDGNPYTNTEVARPGLSQIIPVDSAGNLLSPFQAVIGNYDPSTFKQDWVVGDDGPTEFSYRRSSTYPFDLMRLFALTQPANFFNLGADLDNYKYNSEFNQYLVNNRSYLVPSNIEIYGSGTAKTSYINWIVDYQKQQGINATNTISTLLSNLDVRLVYRLAGFSDQNLLQFYVEKGSPNSTNASLMIPNESYNILLYNNQPFDQIMYSGVIVQQNEGYWTVYGNSQLYAYFTVANPLVTRGYNNYTVQNLSVNVYKNYSATQTTLIPYGTKFYTPQDVAQFLMSYGAYLETQGMMFNDTQNNVQVNWVQMVNEFLYWAQTGWETGSIITLNPAANLLEIAPQSSIVQPLTIQDQNFILNQNLYPINLKDLAVHRDNNLFSVKTQNAGDAMAYGQFDVSNFEHGIIFDNTTLFNDTIYNLVTGLRQKRIFVRGTKSADWNGTVYAGGFIINQNNVKEWDPTVKYTKGAIVLYKNNYYQAQVVVNPASTFNANQWKLTNYKAVQLGLLSNPSARAYESTLFYDINQANLVDDADTLGYSLIGYRPRDYLALLDLTNVAQVQLYQNLIINKGTLNAVSAFEGANLPTGGINYTVHENWAIKSGDFGGVLNDNFVDFRIEASDMTGDPSIVSLTNGLNDTTGSMQTVALNNLFNYGTPITSPDFLATTSDEPTTNLYPDAGYVNFNDVSLASYYYAGLPRAVNASGAIVPIQNFYVGQYAWLANFMQAWGVYAWKVVGQVTQVRNNGNSTVTVTFNAPHNLTRLEPLSIVNFASNIDGYYIVTDVPNIYEVVINLNLNNTLQNALQGLGIGLTFESHRVTNPSDIAGLDLTPADFVDNLVWVDNNVDGNWAVLLKANNYVFQEEIEKPISTTFGAAVAYTNSAGYLISDAGAGVLYRYTYNPLFDSYSIYQTITNTASFGSTIVYSEANSIYVVSQPTGTPEVFIYVLNDSPTNNNLVTYQTITAPGGVTNWGSAMALSGDSNWLYISATANNKVYAYRKENIPLSAGSFTVGQTYVITEVGTTDFTAIGASYNAVGITFVATGVGTGTGTATQVTYTLATTINGSSFGYSSSDDFGASLSTNYDGSVLIVGAPLFNYSVDIEDWGQVSVFNRTVQNFQVQNTLTPNQTSTFTLAWTPTSETALSVSVNGTVVTSSNYSVTSNTLTYTSQLNPGDIVTVSDGQFFLTQTLNSNYHDRTGIHFGYSVANSNNGADILVGSPFEISDVNGQEGAVYKYSNGGAKYGVIIGTGECNLPSPATILINGFAVNLPAGNAATIAAAINSAALINIEAASVGLNNLVIQCVDTALTQVNQELVITAFDNPTTIYNTTLYDLGIFPYTETQIIQCPYTTGATQFGTTVKVDQFNNMVVSAPVATRYEGTVFDFVDELDLNKDTVFDNNATQFVDSYPNAGAVYMFQYLADYNESLTTPGQYVYAQSVNDTSTSYGNSPMYGTALDFNDNTVVIGTPNFLPTSEGGQVVIYTNPTGVPVWSVYRQSAPVVDINKIQNTQLYSASTNETLVNFDYPDPLQGKILGAARENLDYVCGTDPAHYNSNLASNNGNMWGAEQVGQLWFNTSGTRWLNYHQPDTVYNSQYWARVFPGSDVAVYSWVASFSPPSQYTGPGSVFDINQYCVASVLNSSNVVTPVYYFWVRNTNIIFTQTNKTLSDSTIATYIANPAASGIPFMAPLLPSTIAMYNASTFFNADDSVFHIGFATGESGDVAHQEFTLIGEGNAEDFLPGFPPVAKPSIVVTPSGVVTTYVGTPGSLYERYLYSFSGCDGSGATVPDPFLPLAVQSGVQARPRQSFYYDRFLALENYLSYVNSILAKYPIVEIRPDATMLFASGEFYNTPDYWSYANWWAEGYDNSTKSLYQVPYYADLLAINVPVGTIVTVQQNLNGSQEVYIYDGDGVWTRIGLYNGTIEFKSSLWDYSSAQFGWDGNFFDTSSFDQYPSQETYYCIRAINEQIFTEDLLQYRNLSLILMFQYIQSETVESQNFLPWLNKTSLVDVAHTLRELLPYENYVTDNFDFLAGYVNEAKPYHVLIKDFLYEYTGSEEYVSNITDFDVPAQFNSDYQQFISPQLVYSDPAGEYEYLNTDPIWQTAPYTEWYQNYGVALTGQNDFQITTLASYVSTASTFIIVDNINGFPINGVITVDEEQIQYTSIDQSLNMLTGLTRGYNGTTVATHVPTTPIIIDLPPVLLLNGGLGYTTIPRVTAYIDTSIYPAPTVPAQLEAVMGVDSVLSINVIDPGKGYAVTPEIIIDPAEVITFSNTAINSALGTIVVYAPGMQTGDLVQYFAGSDNVGIGSLANGQWYYVNVLQTVPTSVIALYSTYGDAVNNINRIPIFDMGSTSTLTFNIGARATAISTSYPVRENNITIKFDRTTYNSQVIDWEAGAYYGSFFAGNYKDITQVSSSSITLESSQPAIGTILASAQGATFEIVDVSNNQETQWSSTVRYVGSTSSTNNAITLIPQDNNNNPSNPYPNAAGTTIGFYVGMPIQFNGAVVGGIVANQEYYVASIISETQFTISETLNGPIKSLTTATVGTAYLVCFTAQVTNTAVLTVNYPGILTVTNTAAGTNYLTVPTSAIGSGGTNGFYTNLPVFFPENIIGGLVDNQIYYINTVIDEQTFTVSLTENPLKTTATATSSTGNIVTVTSTAGFNANDPIVFTGTTFGGITAGVTYYVSQIINETEMTIAPFLNGTVLSLTNASGSATINDQSDAVQLTNGSGAMIMNVSLPVSPGQVNGQQFTLYNTSGQYPNIAGGVVGNLITRQIDATVANNLNIVAIDQATAGTSFFYENMPIQFSTAIGGLSTGTTYYVLNYSGQTITNNTVTVTNTTTSTNRLTCSSTATWYVGMPITFSGAVFGGIVAAQQYYVNSIVDGTHFTVSTTINGSNLVLTTASGTMTATVPQTISSIQTTVTNASPDGNKLTCNSTAYLYAGMPIVFSQGSLGGVLVGQEYYVKSIVDSTHFTISLQQGGDTYTLFEQNGYMVGTGTQWMTVSASLGGAPVTLTSATSGSVMTQYITGSPVFDISYILGGYRAIITTAGSGFAIDNTITILGTAVGGTTPLNDITLTVNEITSTGGLTSVICAGTVPYISQQYYLKVISSTQFEVYADPNMDVPVSGIDFPFVGFTTDTVTASSTSNNSLTISNTAQFNVNDAVVFTGNTDAAATTIVEYQTYYVVNILNGTQLQVSATPGGSAITIASNASTDFTIAKPGSFALLPEPFFFNQSIVKFNNQVYVCVISNNDPEFVIGKWQLLDSDDPRLNAMDRVIGYYQPTVNMPGVDLTQLFDGVTYPNSIYLGNAFQPSQQYPLDTVLQDQVFTPTNVNITSVIYNNGYYFATANLPEYTGVLYSTDGVNWLITKLLNANVNATRIVYNNGTYVITTENNPTPILRSTDGFTWTANSYYQTELEVEIAGPALQGVAYNNNLWVAAGDSIVISTDTINWTQTHTYTSTFVDVEMYGVIYVTIPSIFSGYVAVGSGSRYDNSLGYTELVPTDVISYSADGINWTDVPSITPNGLNAVAINPSANQLIAVGNNGVIYTSYNGANWYGINEITCVSVNSATNTLNVTNTSGLTLNQAVKFSSSFSSLVANTTYYIKSIVSSTSVTLSATSGGSTLVLTNGTPATQTMMTPLTNTATLNDVVYQNNKWVAVGNSGTIITSTNGINWTTQTSNTTVNLEGITYQSGTWVAVGDNNIVLTSPDSVTWTVTSVLVPVPPVYDVQGETFQAGYGPEELVPGVVYDNFAMTVITRPGTTWPVVEYGHTGYNVISSQITPSSATQTVYSFGNIAHYPAQVFVQKIDATSGLGTTLNQGIDYTVNWLNKTITLATPLPFTPLTDTLRLDVYEVGNGNQLVKSNTNTDPIRLNSTTGFNEIYVDCNYSAVLYAGSGVIVPGTYDIDVRAVQTISSDNSIVCDSVAQLSVNSTITFEGVTFGNIVEGTSYYVKSISTATNSITVSTSFNSQTGQAGPILELTNATGSMYVIIQPGTGTTWTAPLMYHNGTKLLAGGTDIVTNTTAGTNVITTNSTNGMVTGTPITFSADISTWSPDINPLTRYYVAQVISSNSFTISTSPTGSPVKTLTTQQGGSTFITYDYAFGIQPDGTSAKIIFSTGSYTNSADYLAYSLFGQTVPQQIGYTIPETQLFTGTGSQTIFTLSNFSGYSNPSNAVVEVNGLRVAPSTYTITPSNNTITFTSAPSSGAVISVTTFNDTTQQYLNTQTITTSGSNAVLAITNISNAITPALATTTITAVATGTNYITAASTSGFVVGQTIYFQGTSFGGIDTTGGTVYFVKSIVNSTTFTISATSVNGVPGSTFTFASSTTGLMSATVGGQPAIRITTAGSTGFTENQLIRIDGVTGSTQLNGNIYYARVINTNQFDLYTQAYSTSLNAVNYPVTQISAYTGGGYTWAEGSYYLVDTTASATSSTNNEITVASTSTLVVGTPVVFTQSGSTNGTNILGGLIQGTVYYISEITDSTHIKVAYTLSGTVVTLTTATGTINVTQWEQTNPDRLWVTVNGYRVPSSNLRINNPNELSILTPIASGSTVIITNMIPTATPNEEIYMNFVNETGEASVYRANTGTRTWLTQDLYEKSDLIYVNDVTAVTNSIVQTSTVPVASGGVYSIGLTGVDKTIITGITVYDNTTGKPINSAYYQIAIVNLSPVLQITPGSYINVGDSLTITTLVGNTIYINGEQIVFSIVNTANNTLGGLQRGANGTGSQLFIPEYTEVFSMTSNNLLPSTYYNQTWNSYVYNATLGDPLQISQTVPAQFLEVDVT